MTYERRAAGRRVHRATNAARSARWRLRESRGITREDAGYSIRASESKISRMELGRVSFKERDVADLLTLYGVSEEGERLAMLGLVREANAASTGGTDTAR